MCRPVVPLMLAGVLAAATPPAALVRYLPGELGGITALLRYAAARPDRNETRFLFLTGAVTGAAEEVQVQAPDGSAVHLSDEDGADCTLAHVEIVTGTRPMVVVATRLFSPDLRQDDQSRAALMAVQVYRPAAGEDAGESKVVLRASGPPQRATPL